MSLLPLFSSVIFRLPVGDATDLTGGEDGDVDGTAVGLLAAAGCGRVPSRSGWFSTRRRRHASAKGF